MKKLILLGLLALCCGFTCLLPPIRNVSWAFVPGIPIHNGAAVVGTAVTSNAYQAGIFGTNQWLMQYSTQPAGSTNSYCTTWTNTFWDLSNMLAFPFALGCNGALIIPPPGSYHRNYQGTNGGNAINQYGQLFLPTNVYNFESGGLLTAHAATQFGESHDDMDIDSTRFEVVGIQTFHTMPSPYERYEVVGYNSKITRFGDVAVTSNQFNYCWLRYNTSNSVITTFYNTTAATNWRSIGSNFADLSQFAALAATNTASQSNVYRILFWTDNNHLDNESNMARAYGTTFFIWNASNVNLSPFGGY